MLQYSLTMQIWKRLRYRGLLIELLVSVSSRTGPSTVATVAISSTALLTEDLTYRSLDIMLLEMVMALEVKVTCRERRRQSRGGNALATRPTHLELSLKVRIFLNIHR